MKEKRMRLCAFVFLLSMSLPALATDASLFGEVNAAFKSGAWPGAIDYADELVREYPRSPFIAKALSCKAESLYRLGRAEEAAQVFQQSILYAADDGELLVQNYYWLGRMYLVKSKFSLASKAFVKGAAVYKTRFPSEQNIGKTTRFYHLCILFGARAYYWEGEYEDSIFPFEYVIEHGNFYSNSEYGDTVKMLFDSYMNCKEYEKLLTLYQRLPESHDSISKDLRGELTLTAGDAQVALEKFKDAYDTYCQVLTGDDPVLASVALQKAYTVASGHVKEVGKDPGSILSTARDGLDDYPALLEEFWTRLGVDAFEAGDFKKASSYFDNAEKEETSSYSPLIGLYRAEMSEDVALAVLADYAKKTEAENTDYAKAYECAFAKWHAVNGDWEEVKTHSRKALSMNGSPSGVKPQLVYWDALACYNTGNTEEARTKILGQDFENGTELWAKSRILMAQILYKQGRTLNALKMYEEVNAVFPLEGADIADYSKLLFADGQMAASYRQSLRVDLPDAWYMTALSSFNRQEWETSEKAFTKYLTRKNQKNTPNAQFYLGYVHYKMGKNELAVNELAEFVKTYPDHVLLWNGCMTAANSALQLNRYDDACDFASKAISASQTESQKEAAITLCASVYADNQKYEEAVAYLSESLKLSNDFGVQARYQAAEIYARAEQISKSDSLYAEIENKFSSNPLSDDASYRRGELYYSRDDYDSAINRFTNYQKKYPRGKFLDASYFYCADAYAKTNKIPRAVLQYESLVSSMPQSPYVYNAKKNLVVLNRSLGEYSQALSLAEKLLSEFPQESKTDGIPTQIAELRQLASGVNEKLLSLRNAYEQNGKLSTPEGRASGTELAEYLWESVKTQKDAYNLAKELYAAQDSSSKKGEESDGASRTALIVAQYRRMQNENKESASSYLDVARHARIAGNSQLAERALYSAVEAFDAAALYGDAQETAKNMKELYPKSKYTSKAMSLVAKETR